MNGDDLFTGEEGARADGGTAHGGGEVVGNDQPPLAGSDGVGLKAWLRDLTYDEVHAFVLGVAPMLLGLVLLPFVPLVGTIFLGLAALLTAAAITNYHLPNRALGYIVREVHYYLGGQALAAVLGIGFVGVVYTVGLVGGLLPTQVLPKRTWVVAGLIVVGHALYRRYI